jgi:serine/threonine protein kinase
MLKRISDEIRENRATLTVLDPFTSKSFWETDFDSTIPIGEGDQGTVYAVLVRLSDGTEARMVVKRLALQRPRLMAYSTSTEPSISDCSSPASSVAFGSGRKAERCRANTSSPFNSFRRISHDSKELSDGNLINLVHILEHQGRRFALSAYCGIFLDEFIEGTLRHLYDNDTPRYLTAVKKIMLDTLGALLTLNYKKGFVHRDIKPENIALFGDIWVLVDFETSAKVGTITHDLIGSPYYTHPSCYIDNNKSTHPGNDMYALSLVFEAILYLPKRFKSETLKELIDEKLLPYRNAREAKYLSDGTSHLRVRTSCHVSVQMERLVSITERMGSLLLSDQPDIHDIIEEILCLSTKDDTSFLDELYKSSSSDGYFSSSQVKRTSFEKHASFRRETRRRSTVQCLTRIAESESSGDDIGSVSNASCEFLATNASFHF